MSGKKDRNFGGIFQKKMLIYAQAPVSGIGLVPGRTIYGLLCDSKWGLANPRVYSSPFCTARAGSILSNPTKFYRQIITNLSPKIHSQGGIINGHQGCVR